MFNHLLRENDTAVKEITWGGLNPETMTFELEDIIYNGVAPYSQEGFEIFKSWCKNNNVFHYAKCREEFSPRSGLIEAVEGGYDYIVFEDLS